MAVEKEVFFRRENVENVRVVSQNANGFGNELKVGDDGRAWVSDGDSLSSTIVGTAVPSADTNVHQFGSQVLTQPLVVMVDDGAIGSVTLYRDNGTNAIAKLYGGGRTIFFITNTNLLWYKFSTHAATEIFYWHSCSD